MNDTSYKRDIVDIERIETFRSRVSNTCNLLLYANDIEIPVTERSEGTHVKQ